jgi:hypothetical protein
VAVVAVLVTTVVPTWNVEPDGGLLVTVTEEQLLVADTVKLTEAEHCPGTADTTILLGQLSTGTGSSTVRAAAFDVVVPHELVNAALYLLPLSAVLAVNVSVLDVAPGMGLNSIPPSVLTSHCTDAKDPQLKSETKVAVLPPHTL